MVVMKRSKVQSVLQFVWLKILQEQAASIQNGWNQKGLSREVQLTCFSTHQLVLLFAT
jgi:hypothetical protein